MPKTVIKLKGIMDSLKSHWNGKFSFAAPAVGAIPIMTPQYGDAMVLGNGGQWYGGNLKGIMYNMILAYGESVFNGWDLGLMTYDIGCLVNSDCGGQLPYGCTLSE